MTPFPYWWLRYKAFLILFLIVFVVIIVFSLLYIFGGEWTGFKETIGPQLKPNQPYQPAKTLWDWLTVVTLPVTLGGVVAFLSTMAQRRDAERMLQMQDRSSLDVLSDSQRHAALQAYLDRITQLLLEKKIREAKPDDEVRNLARVHTLMVLRRLDPYRKRDALLFLQDLGLIKKGLDNSFTDFMKGADLSRADLRGADLTEADLSRANLREADLTEADLRGADLTEADLSRANLREADLTEADLRGADLRGADLKDATGFTIEELEKKVKSLKDATMPDGSIHT